jgi:hypothetical protein
MFGVDFVGIACPDDTPPCGLAGLARLTRTAIDDLGLTQACVDGFSDCRTLPPDAAAALTRLQDMASERHAHESQPSRWSRWRGRRGPSNMGIEVDLSGDDRRIIEDFGPYSIHTELSDSKRRVVLVLHDSGTGVSISADDRQQALVSRFLHEGGARFVERP